MISKYFLSLSLILCSSLSAMELDKKHLSIPQGLGEVKVIHKNNGKFYINDARVQIYNTDKELRGVSREKLTSLLAAGSYIQIKQIADNDFALSLHGRLPGGGLIGANIGAWVGKAAVYVVGHGAIMVAGALTGPAAPATILALEGWFAYPIEAASMAGAVAGGIIGGVATGPV